MNARIKGTYKKMFYFPPTLILRHKRENLKKCSLSGLENRSDCLFLTYPLPKLPNIDQYCVLTFDAPQLSLDDANRGLFIIDGTWRYAQIMTKIIPPQGNHVYRSLPSHLKTAYPRRQPDCPNPERGLASIEALYAAYTLLGRPTKGLLDRYHWKEDFLRQKVENQIK
jgi:pre-rRNA-processing protein TSR3